MEKRENLNLTIAIVGLVASLISIFAFITGASSISGVGKREEPKAPVVVIQPPVQVPTPEKKKDTPGDKIVAPVKNGVNWLSGRLKPPR